MKKHSLGFIFHLLIIYLVSVTLFYAQHYVTGPNSKGIIQGYFLSPSSKRCYVPGPSLKEIFQSYISKGIIQGYVPGPSSKHRYVPLPCRDHRYVPSPSSRGSFHHYVPCPSPNGPPHRYVPAPSSKGTFHRYVPAPSSKGTFMVNGVGKDGPSLNPLSLDSAGSGAWKSWYTRVAVAVAGLVCVVFFIIFLCVCVYELGKRKGSSVVPYQNTFVHSTSDCNQVNIMVGGYDGVSQASRDAHVEPGNMDISIQDLKNATNNFCQDNILGRGGSATVYKGELPNVTKIAVKRMNLSEMGGVNEFQTEITVLSKFRHRHVVVFLGYCLVGNERLLVYEYMPQGTLSRLLFDWKPEGLKPLEWTQRLIIALDVARGVQYIHDLAQQSFIHRDLKPSNILLADDMRAKVADFGLVRPAPRGEYSFVQNPAGTIGYFAPEYAGSLLGMGLVTTKIDVFSFGVILLELITGRRALEEKGVHLMHWLQEHKDKGTFRKAIDPTLNHDEEALAGVSRVAELAGYCCAYEPHRRPDMSHVVNVLSSLSERWNPSDPGDSNKNDFDEEDIVHLFSRKPSEHDPHDKSDIEHSEIVGWKPSEHYPHEDSHETETEEEPLARVVELSCLKTSEHVLRNDTDTGYSEIVGWKPSEHYPHDDSDTDDDSYVLDCASEPHQSHAFDIFWHLTEPWKPYEPEPEADDDSYESDLDEEAPSHLVELAVVGCDFKPHQSHAFDVFSPLAKPSKPFEPESDDYSYEIDLDEEALASMAELFGWKSPEHDPDDDSDTDYSEIFCWKPSEHYPLDDSDTEDDSYKIDLDGNVVELAGYGCASEPH
ncbi:putative protein kinase RLK-Pelle-LRR-IX family [Helianthus anomalus]